MKPKKRFETQCGAVSKQTIRTSDFAPLVPKFNLGTRDWEFEVGNERKEANGKENDEQFMIRSSKQLREFESGLVKNSKLSLEQKFKILEAMYEEARALEHFQGTDPLDGIEVDLRIAKMVNHVSKTTYGDWGASTP
ncbi:MAG: hypothetical protein D6743_02545 [Calditrichaeota bacterium]|nr:MAG: hypothetical protein D6743_02545 [Calditrichota bacterium]